ncbi:hypothetical protein BDV34DRAFT_186329 [Aspergillus parasiticus]|uniref:Uncharacterized protein n=1 Tax=Aspergillus parasiticus TaxID=5067 RepID=A0A5N6DZT4_ASPPA|nr:hypothetical protein BDV34DRAFT_186329 [Aspergillus parasiticus]
MFADSTDWPSHWMIFSAPSSNFQACHAGNRHKNWIVRQTLRPKSYYCFSAFFFVCASIVTCHRQDPCANCSRPMGLARDPPYGPYRGSTTWSFCRQINSETLWAYFCHGCGKVVISDQWSGYAEISICAYRSPLIFALRSNGVLSVKPILYFG